MEQREVIDRVREVLAEEFELDAATLRPDSTLYDEMGLDSLDSVDMIVALEKEFKFKVHRAQDEERIRAIRSVAEVCDFVEYKASNPTT